MKIDEIITETVKQRLDPKCWTGKHKEGTKIKGGIRVNNCVPNESVEEAANAAQQAAIAINMEKNHKKPKSKNVAEATGDQKFDSIMGRMTAEPKYPDKDMPPTSIPELIQWAQENRKPYHGYFAEWARKNKFTNVNDALEWFGDNVDPSNPWGPKDRIDVFGRPAAEELQDAAKHDPKAAELMKVFRCYEEIVFDWPDDYRQMNMPEDLDQQFNMIEDMVESLAEEHGVDADVIWEDFESVDDNELLETAAWRRSAGKSKKGGLNAKGVASYRRENPGSHLQMAVTTKPSKLKRGSKAAKRRKSFCARMGGVKGPMKKPNGKPTRKALALRKWNC